MLPGTTVGATIGTAVTRTAIGTAIGTAVTRTAIGTAIGTAVTRTAVRAAIGTAVVLAGYATLRATVGQALHAIVGGSFGFGHSATPHQGVSRAGQPGRRIGHVARPGPYASDEPSPATVRRPLAGADRERVNERNLCRYPDCGVLHRYPPAETSRPG